jgi:predicted ATPase/DNA-binding CsgD family transcriptional regulator/DNA-binding XRE family transcriptional regulator
VEAKATAAFGDLLRERRIAAGLTQEQLAERAGLSVYGIQKLERGLTNPYRDTANRLMLALGLDAKDEARLRAAVRPVRRHGSLRPIPLDLSGRTEGVDLNNLPAQVSTFVGRAQELEEVSELVSRERLVTLTGPGGVGKTRLALQVAQRVTSSYAHGAWLVDLAPVADPTLVSKAVALALGVHEQPGRSVVDTLVERLHSRELLLLMDNCEHLGQTSAELVDHLLRTCSRLTVLATSRELLHVAGERVFRVPSLQLPEKSSSPTVDEIERADAVQLLVQRATSVQPDFCLSDQNAVAVVQVCWQLDGIPLALELAAARLSALSVEQLAERLGDRFKLLTGGSATALPRHRTLYGTLEWSHDLLSAPERTLLRRLSVFAGGWTLQAAEAVCSGSELRTDDILDVLSGLVAKSLVAVVGEQPDEGLRYRLLETVRQYGWSKLCDSDEQAAICRSHLQWCVALAEEAEPHLFRHEQVRWLDRLEAEHDNLRVALTWSRTYADGGSQFGRLVKALLWFWYLRGHLAEGQPWIESAVYTIEDENIRAGGLLTLAWMAYGRGGLEHGTVLSRQSLLYARECGNREIEVVALTSFSFTLRDRGLHEESEPLLREALSLARDIDYRWGEAFCLYLLNQEAGHRGDLDAVENYCSLALPIFRDLGERLGLAYTLKDLSRITFERADYARAAELAEESLLLSRELGNRRGICFALTALARDARRRGEYERAGDLLRDALSIWHELGNRPHVGVTFTAIGSLAVAQSRFDDGARLLGAAEGILESAAAARSRGEMKVEGGYDEAVLLARAALGDDVFATRFAEGRALNLDDAMGLAVAVTRRAPNMATSGLELTFEELSPREQEIARLITRGLSNPEIASALVIARRTVDTHVNHILAKLNVHTRAQVAGWVVERDLNRHLRA